ncbi:hypothetical protein [Pandoravirus japonicus]|uniref:Uncharacterized protein n=1 Tax=Pandoravirus japonicus TaxID=2823154 RepID=A0A811BPW4_9VIRU|nr:hypothetical protein [Pandoravirus japonicus]
MLFPPFFKTLFSSCRPLDDHNARKAHNPRGNVAPFCDVFAAPLARSTDGDADAADDPGEARPEGGPVAAETEPRRDRGAGSRKKSGKGRRNGRVRPGRPDDDDDSG